MNRAVRRRPSGAVPFWLALAGALAALPALSAQYDRAVEHPFGSEIRSVEIENLAGAATVVRSESGRISATVSAEDSAGKSARQLADAMAVEFEQRGDRLIVRANYPLGSGRRIHYPRLRDDVEVEPSWLASMFDFGGSGVRYQGRSVRVLSHASSGVPTIWADFQIALPAGVDLKLKNLVGSIRSTDAEGHLSFDSSSGDVVVEGGRGEVVADTGSGDVEVSGFDGDVSADTGSGDVTMTRVHGDRLVADTGSGDVRYVECSGSIDADTGSGDVTGRDLVLGRSVRADTGSGNVHLNGDFSAVRHILVDTGSGDVQIAFGATPSVRLKISTGSGDIDVDVDAARIRRSHDDVIADLGDAEGDGLIDTGSGDVSVRGGR
jgi:hypothetical protein